MRILIGASAALLFASVAAAQPTPATPTPPAAPPSACGEAQPAPAVPDPAHTTAAQMTRANQSFEAWATDTRTKLQCRQAELRTLAAQVAAGESAYNTQAAAFTGTVNSWQSATTAFNQQHGASTSRRGHGGIVGNDNDVRSGHHGSTESQ